MRKVIISLASMIGTLILVLPMIGSARSDDYAEARIVKTERADVFQTIGLQGQLSFVDERYILSTYTGYISDICVEEGQRVAKEEALIRFDADSQERVASAFVSGLDHSAEYFNIDNEWQRSILAQSVQRADEDCTIRQILAKEQGRVMAGTPLLRVSGTAQEIRCVAAPADAENITPGMWAWISDKGECLCNAVVKSVEKRSDDTGVGQVVYLIRLEPSQNIDYEEGANIQVDIYINGSNDVVSLPIEAITDRDTVWWISDGRICTEIPARIILCDEKRAWVDLPEGISVAVGEYTEGKMVVEAPQ